MGAILKHLLPLSSPLPTPKVQYAGVSSVSCFHMVRAISPWPTVEKIVSACSRGACRHAFMYRADSCLECFQAHLESTPRVLRWLVILQING